MVNMPAIKNGLNKRFLGRVPNIDNGDRIIAEGAAWIAHDELRLTLSKPIEILVADTSGQGAYHTLLNVGEKLPLENETIKTENTRLFCVDPREGKAVIEIAKPARIGNAQPHDPRELLCVAAVPVDPNAEPLIERIECHLQIDHNYIAEIRLRSTGRGAEAAVSFHNLEFGLALPTPFKEGPADIDDKEIPRNIRGPARIVANARSNITQRTNVALKIREDMTTYELWRYVPGDIVMQWRENHFDNRSEDMSKRQQLERDFYIPCGTCKRLNSQIVAEGPIEACRGRRCGSHMRNPHHAAARQQNAQ